MMKVRWNRLGMIAAVFAVLCGRIHAGDGTIDLLLSPTATVTINAPGSYVVVSGVVKTNATSAITIGASAGEVTIDLNGQTLDGGSIIGGIDGIGGLRNDVTIRNGKIVNFSGEGINQNQRCVVEDVKIRNCDTGILLGADAIVSDCAVSACQSWGIFADANARVVNCAANGNNLSGTAIVDPNRAGRRA